ncbi:hypothetical protein N9T33_04090 [Pseudomonadota bacterium]|jgi:hypothetical protein|nr:hypothetical protein [Pseudomonadota bacterium]
MDINFYIWLIATLGVTAFAWVILSGKVNWEVTHLKRFILVFISGLFQIFFAGYLLLELSGADLGWHITSNNIMFAPGILVFLVSGYLTASYYFGDQQKNNVLYDEYTALRYYKTAAVGYFINGVGVFVLFSIQDWSNWSYELANNMIYQIAAFAWLIFGILLVWFSLGDYRESKSG